MKIRVKEVREWMKSLDENKWRKTYNVDARRVAHFAKNVVEGKELVLPKSLQRKDESYEYKRERKMATEYAKVVKRAMKEAGKAKKEKVVQEAKMDSLRSMIREIIKEESDYQKFFKTVLDKFDIKSPAELDDEKKKEFFNYIDKNWNGKSEKGEDGKTD